MIFAFLIFLFFSPSLVNAQSNNLVIVNQVRGTECCEIGSLDHLQLQLKTNARLGLKTTYALRYDALQDQAMKSLITQSQQDFPALIQVGAFLEITPQLAKAAGVPYSAKERDWYKTQHAYHPGYKLEERILLVDAYMSQYFQVFGEYPKLTVGWFVDTHTLNYLHEKYGVIVHELTREQWGTDSYTLAGGPVHYPFRASHNWSFVPGDSDLTIIRQTLPDPASNYGDRTSSHTSQPNDYGQNKDFSYFTSLIDTAFSQPPGQDGVAVLGLENSMGLEFQEEYVKQLEYLSSTYKDLFYPTPEEIRDLADSSQVKIYRGSGAYWITTPNYQLRLIELDGRIMLTDMRLYNQDLRDPYFSRQVQNGGFFVSPYLIDSSRWHQLKTNWFKEMFTPVYNEGYVARNDFLTIPTHLSLPAKQLNSQIEITKSADIVKLSYLSKNHQPIEFSFLISPFTASGLTLKDLNYHDKTGGKLPVKESRTRDSYRLEWFNQDQVVSRMVVDCGEICDFQLQVDSQLFATAQDAQSFFLLPSTIVDKDTSGSLIYPSLNYLIHGRSPARVVVFPRNAQGNPVTLPYPVEFEGDGMTLISDPLVLQSQEAQFYDFEVESPGDYHVKVLVPGLESHDLYFFFAPDCRADVSICLKNPQSFYYYLRAIIAGKLQK